VEKNYDLRELSSTSTTPRCSRNQWQLKTAAQEDYARLARKVSSHQEKAGEEILASGIFEPKVVYGYFLRRVMETT